MVESHRPFLVSVGFGPQPNSQGRQGTGGPQTLRHGRFYEQWFRTRVDRETIGSRIRFTVDSRHQVTLTDVSPNRQVNILLQGCMYGRRTRIRFGVVSLPLDTQWVGIGEFLPYGYRVREESEVIVDRWTQGKGVN